MVTGLAWAIRQCLRPDPVWRPTWILALISASVILIMLQTIPLPQARTPTARGKPGKYPAVVECRTAGFRLARPLANHLLRSGGDAGEPCAGAVLWAVVFRNGRAHQGG